MQKTPTKLHRGIVYAGLVIALLLGIAGRVVQKYGGPAAGER